MWCESHCERLTSGRQSQGTSVPSLTSHDKRIAEPVDAETINMFSGYLRTQMFTTRPIQYKLRVILKTQCYVTNPSVSRSYKLLLPFMVAHQNLVFISHMPYVFPKYMN